MVERVVKENTTMGLHYHNGRGGPGGWWVIVAVHAGDEEVHAEPFEATSLAWGRLWAD
jgi:hypothetical protein